MSDKWKYVSVWTCITNIIWAAIALGIVAIVPITFSSSEMTFTFTRLPFVGDGTVTELFAAETEYISNYVTLSPDKLALVNNILLYLFYGFFAILIADILFSFILAIFRINVMRKIFEILGALFGIALILNMLACLLFIFFNVMAAISGGDIMEMIYTSGISTMLVMFIVSLIFIFRQFKCFKIAFPKNLRKTYKVLEKTA